LDLKIWVVDANIPDIGSLVFAAINPDNNENHSHLADYIIFCLKSQVKKLKFF